MSLRGEILALSLGYALLGVVLLLGLLRARLPWGVKAAAIIVTSAFYAVVYFKTEGLLGWSAYSKLPPRFQVLWTRVVEPNLALDEPGAIHLWVEELDDANLPSGVPRAYRLPYADKIARKVDHVRDEIAAGRPQGGRAEQFGSADAPPAPADAVIAVRGEEAGGDASSGGFLDSAFLGGDSQSVEFAPLPVPKLPDKDVLPRAPAQ
ncbi:MULTISPECIES: hypothetical protein [Rhodopseudomonas]|uniref:Uncharacterized protein n=1 Tax=Rhodopseudomonas palustris TaxID=1076 RepID=A0A0D7EQ23_RHOPL|nr:MULTISPECIES: hypothetical protein [Rhodopseudomonas]KIZ42746.1 hypothetical protein OO17_12360 [Rhodopseudomonas palustris]MDF3813075.1 hypothetical protein [Rhodopseudomonas sp. BAL398]WOK19255.1 hypothetical protein RBJ75_06990 [Rhodopseudomonas sp. BAL398]